GNNIVPPTATCGGTVRSFDPAVQAMVIARMQALVTGTAAAYGVGIDLEYLTEEMPTVNDPAAVEFAIAVAGEICGPACVDGAVQRRMGAEDFSYMLQSRPGAYVFLGQGGAAQWHDPAFDFNDEVAPIGAS